MVRVLDLFHQPFFTDGEYTAVINYEEETPQVCVYDPAGEWCGGTNASNHFARLAAVMSAIKTRRAYINHKNKHGRKITESVTSPSGGC
jgi:hypothetical protein